MTYYDISRDAVILCWFIFAVVFLAKRQPAGATEIKRNPGAKIGMILEGIAYVLVWSRRRTSPELFPSGSNILEVVLCTAAVLIAVCSLWITISAVKTLGKQWALEARVIEDHQLITRGPYRIVRNPIYTGMLGLLISTGLVMSTWYIILLAIVVFMVGTAIRVHSEEKVLREHFGEIFEEYRRRVPAYIPNFRTQHSGHANEAH